MTDELKQEMTEKFNSAYGEEVKIGLREALRKIYIDGAEHGYQYALQHPQWIPVEEEQPKAIGDYIICEKRGLVREAHYFKLEDLWLFHGGALASPTHWMPLPTPPRKEENDE